MKLSAKLTRTASALLAFIMAVCSIPAASAAADTSVAEYAEQFSDCAEYDVDKYTNPYWSGEIVYNEAVFPLEEQDGSISDISLMYKAAQIVSVRNSLLDTLYVEGVDYELTSDGKLRILEGGDILTVPYNKVYGYNSEGWYHSEGLDGQIIGWGEISFYHYSQLSITYIPADEWTGFVPEPKGELLPKTIERLTGGGDLNIVYLGDSITWGANSSGLRGWAPYADIWCDMTTLRLENLYPDANITYVNSNKGGETAGWAADNLDSLLLSYEPDLAVIEFGANDGMEGISASEFLSNIGKCIERIQAALPDCEIILVAPYICQPERFPIERFISYAEGLYQFESEGVAVADVTSLYQSILENKIYLDTTGNNMCHPNDFAARMLAQVVTETLTPSDEAGIAAYKAILSEKLTAAAAERLYDYTIQPQADAILEKGLNDIDSAATVTSAYFKYNNSAALLDAVPQAYEMQLYNMDYESLIFNSGYKTGIIMKEMSLRAEYDFTERALKLTTDGGSNPYVALDYSYSSISAEDYPYVVVTYKGAANNTSTSKYGELYFMAGDADHFLAASKVRFSAVSDGEYHSAVLDMSAIENWSGTLSRLRFDPFTSAGRDDVMYLESIVLCRTAEEAEAAAALRSERAGSSFEGIYSGGAYDESSSVSDFAVMGEDAVLLGDLNGDNKIGASDINTVKRVINGMLSADVTVCDINSDTRVNAADIMLMKRISTGMMSPVYSGGVSGEVVPTAEGMTVTLLSGSDAVIMIDTSSLGGASSEYVVLSTVGSGCTGAVGVNITSSDGSTASAGTFITEDSYTTVIRTGTDVSTVEIAFPEGAETGDSITVRAIYLCADRESADLAADIAAGTVYEAPGWVEIRFDSAEKLSLISSVNNTTATYDSSDKALKLMVSGGNIDPWALLDLSACGISADEYKYIVYTYKIGSYNGSDGEIFLCAGDTSVPTAGRSTTFSLSKTGKYESSVLDLSSLSFWSGDIHSVRLDYFNTASMSNYVLVDSVTFCRTAEEAQQYIENNQ